MAKPDLKIESKKEKKGDGVRIFNTPDFAFEKLFRIIKNNGVQFKDFKAIWGHTFYITSPWLNIIESCVIDANFDHETAEKRWEWELSDHKDAITQEQIDRLLSSVCSSIDRNDFTFPNQRKKWIRLNHTNIGFVVDKGFVQMFISFESFDIKDDFVYDQFVYSNILIYIANELDLKCGFICYQPTFLTLKNDH